MADHTSAASASALFVITEVHLRDEDITGECLEPGGAADFTLWSDEHRSSSDESEREIFVDTEADLELAKQMAAMGMPSSFSSSTRFVAQTSKTRKPKSTAGKQDMTVSKGDCLMHLKPKVESIKSARKKKCRNRRRNVLTASYDAVQELELLQSSENLVEGGEPSKGESAKLENEGLEYVCHYASVFLDGPEREGELDSGYADANSSQAEDTCNTILPDPAISAVECFWQKFSDEESGHFFYWNQITHESTWELPEGVDLFLVTDCTASSIATDSEHIGIDLDTEGSFNSSVMAAGAAEATLVSTKAHSVAVDFEVGQALDTSLREAEPVEVSEIVVTKASCVSPSGSEERTWKETIVADTLISETGSMISPSLLDKSMRKYWFQRYHLFSKFDQGVKLDSEGLFSVTPEAIAKHQASRCKPGVIVDAFTGIGGNAIQFALANHEVIAIDIDPKKIECAQHNARIYGAEHLITFKIGDFFELAPTLQADIVFLSPPWGGPDYLNVEKYDLMTMLEPKDGVALLKAAKTIAPNIAMFLPRNIDMDQLAQLSYQTDPAAACEVEQAYLNGKLKAVTAYFGDFPAPTG